MDLSVHSIICEMHEKPSLVMLHWQDGEVFAVL